MISTRDELENTYQALRQYYRTLEDQLEQASVFIYEANKKQLLVYLEVADQSLAKLTLRVQEFRLALVGLPAGYQKRFEEDANILSQFADVLSKRSHELRKTFFSEECQAIQLLLTELGILFFYKGHRVSFKKIEAAQLALDKKQGNYGKHSKIISAIGTTDLADCMKIFTQIKPLITCLDAKLTATLFSADPYIVQAKEKLAVFTAQHIKLNLQIKKITKQVYYLKSLLNLALIKTIETKQYAIKVENTLNKDMFAFMENMNVFNKINRNFTTNPDLIDLKTKINLLKFDIKIIQSKFSERVGEVNEANRLLETADPFDREIQEHIQRFKSQNYLVQLNEQQVMYGFLLTKVEEFSKKIEAMEVKPAKEVEFKSTTILEQLRFMNSKKENAVEESVCDSVKSITLSV